MEFLDGRYAKLPQPWWLVFLIYEALLVGAWWLERRHLRDIRAATGDPGEAARADRRYGLVWVLNFLLLQWPLYRTGTWWTRFPRTWATVAVGVAVALAGLALRRRAIAHLREHFTYVVRVGESHALVTTGPYARIRHPAYTGLLLFFVGLQTILCDHRLVLIVGTWVLIVVAIRMRREEKALRARFGEAYEDWRKRTKRIIPGVF